MKEGLQIDRLGKTTQDGLQENTDRFPFEQDLGEVLPLTSMMQSIS